MHGGFSDHETNWTYVAPRLRDRFTVVAIARRGRGETPGDSGHLVQDEGADVVAVVRALGAPVFLLGHSFGALCALEAAMRAPELVAKLVLYEPPRPSMIDDDLLARLETLGAAKAWDAVAETFLREAIRVKPDELRALRSSPDWAAWTSDAGASLSDLRAMHRYTFAPERARALAMPTLLLYGTESVRARYMTDALADTVRDARVVALGGQAHEGMTTAPHLFAEVVERFLLEDRPRRTARAAREARA
ncbi:putative hydrolase [Sandaracinus amylolyticus]|uniref:Putative hydrolase n=1 Tax=Sandaracinus amylolyticus TaxID=927083 RepID=A0A0F6VZ95_9BACT|nr:putative hydrolase [Sandaracinus amylolyticus]